MKCIKIQPLADRVLVQPQKLKLRLHRAFTFRFCKGKPQQGKVVAVGKGKEDKNDRKGWRYRSLRKILRQRTKI